MGVRIQVGLWDTISCALQYDCDAVDVEGSVFEELPRDFRCLVGAGRYTRRVSWDQEDGENAGPRCYSSPYSQRSAEAVAIKQGSEEERAGRADDVFAG